MNRILLLDTGKEWGGGTNSMLELLRRIDRSRFALTALFYHNYAQADSDVRAELEKIGIPFLLLDPARQPLWAKLAKELLRGLLSWHRPLRQWAVHRIELAWRIQPDGRRIARILREGGFDLLYMNNQPSSNAEGYLAAAAAGVPALQHCRIDVALNRHEVRLANRVARKIICVSQGVADSLLAQGIAAEKCAVVHNGIDGAIVPPAPVALAGVPGPVIGAVGSLIARKSVADLLRAAAILARESMPFRLLIVGDGPQREALKRLAAELEIAGRTEFTGFQREPLPWVAAMDILVLASAKEGLPRVILEAMLLGKPVVAADIVGPRELVRVGGNGFLYPHGDVPALAGHLRRLVGDATLRHDMGRRGREIVLDEFSIERYVEGVEAVMAEVLAA